MSRVAAIPVHSGRALHAVYRAVHMDTLHVAIQSSYVLGERAAHEYGIACWQVCCWIVHADSIALHVSILHKKGDESHSVLGGGLVQSWTTFSQKRVVP